MIRAWKREAREERGDEKRARKTWTGEVNWLLYGVHGVRRDQVFVYCAIRGPTISWCRKRKKGQTGDRTRDYPIHAGRSATELPACGGIINSNSWGLHSQRPSILFP